MNRKLQATVPSASEIDARLKAKLKSAHLHEYIDASKSDLLEYPDGFLAEIVLNNAGRLEEAKQVVESVRSELRKKEGVELDSIVRALWEVKAVERLPQPESAGAPPGAFGLPFKAVLKSGDTEQEVWVALTPSAYDELRRARRGDDESLRTAVRDFLRHRLSIGGAGYWDPAKSPNQEFDDSYARYLIWRPYESLKASIDDIFNPGVGSRRRQIESFAKLMNYGSRRIHSFRDALTDLPGPGGAYTLGQRLPTSNYEFHEMLLEPEKRELESYYLDQVSKAERDFPDLKSKFPNVFN